MSTSDITEGWFEQLGPSGGSHVLRVVDGCQLLRVALPADDVLFDEPPEGVPPSAGRRPGDGIECLTLSVERDGHGRITGVVVEPEPSARCLATRVKITVTTPAGGEPAWRVDQPRELAAQMATTPIAPIVGPALAEHPEVSITSLAGRVANAPHWVVERGIERRLVLDWPDGVGAVVSEAEAHKRREAEAEQARRDERRAKAEAQERVRLEVERAERTERLAKTAEAEREAAPRRLTAATERLAAQRATAAGYWEQVRRGGFVMPYTFVPLPPVGAVDRARRADSPATATQAALTEGRAHYRLDYRVRALTPLLGQRTADDVRVPPVTDDGRCFFPGSSVKGALRSVFEALTGSCLAIFDEETQPVYREPAVNTTRSAADGWVIAIVDEVTDGRVVSVRPTKRHRWVRLTDLTNNWREQLTSGDRLDIRDAKPGRGSKHTKGKQQSDGKDSWNNVTCTKSASGEWVVLATDTSAREGSAKWRWAVAQDPLNGPEPPVRVRPEAWALFLTEVGGSEDMRLKLRGRLDKLTREIEGHDTGHGNKRVIGRRCAAVPEALTPGMPVWARIGEKGVERIALSQIWRRFEPSAPPRLRVPPDATACTDPECRCPACRLFGYADRRAGDGGSQTRASGGRVRFSQLTATEPTALLPKAYLPVMGSPRPGSGQVYLRLRRDATLQTDVPLRHWGSNADRSTPGEAAPINGRKFYWKTTPLPPKLGRQRYTAGEVKEDSEVHARARLIPDGTEFAGSIVIEGATEQEIGALVAVLRPDLLWGDAPEAYGWSLGGGKPIGLGLVTTVDLSVYRTDGDRWRSLEPADARENRVSEDELRRLVTQLRETIPDDVQAAAWPALQAVQSIDIVPGDVICYPLAFGDSPTDARADAHTYLGLEPGYDYWKETAGLGEHPLELLPLPSEYGIQVAQKPTGRPLLPAAAPTTGQSIASATGISAKDLAGRTVTPGPRPIPRPHGRPAPKPGPRHS